MKRATARAFVAVGSNIEPARKVREALRLLAARMRVVGVSTVYRTRALERPEHLAGDKPQRSQGHCRPNGPGGNRLPS